MNRSCGCRTSSTCKPGQQLMLNTAPGGVVSVRCGPVALFEGRMGQKNNNVAVKIERELVAAAGQ